ncbi:MAG: hypothetical protein ACYCOY_13940 [Metallibacterium sp.]
MPSHPATVKLATLRELVDAGTVRRVTLVGQTGGFAVLARYGMHERTLAAKTGAPRLFASIDSAARELRTVGIAAFEVDTANYAPSDLLRRRRPDRAAALKAVHQAAEHDAWFRAQVEQAIHEADNPTTRWVPHEDVQRDMVQQRAALQARIERERA